MPEVPIVRPGLFGRRGAVEAEGGPRDWLAAGAVGLATTLAPGTVTAPERPQSVHRTVPGVDVRPTQNYRLVPSTKTETRKVCDEDDVCTLEPLEPVKGDLDLVAAFRAR